MDWWWVTVSRVDRPAYSKLSAHAADVAGLVKDRKTLDIHALQRRDCGVMAALHALMVGVSAYPHLLGGDGVEAGHGYGMRQLSAPAASAVALRHWLEATSARLTVPLGSVRTLLSPSPTETATDSGLVARSRGATWDDLSVAAQEWRKDCEENPDSIALFYFAGHGVQRTRSDSVLLLSDFADRTGNPLLRAVDVNNLFGGMAPTAARKGMARTQLWFIDACRVLPTEFAKFETLQATDVFEVELSERDERCAPIYFGAIPGGSAYSAGGGRTLFCRALLESLEHAGGVRKQGQGCWEVTTGSLLAGLQAEIAQINSEKGADQKIWDGGQMEDPDRAIVSLVGVPEVPVSLEVAPATAAGRVTVSVRDLAGNPKLGPAALTPNPFATRWTAGTYLVQTSPGLPGVEPDLQVRPPRCDWKAIVP